MPMRLPVLTSGPDTENQNTTDPTRSFSTQAGAAPGLPATAEGLLLFQLSERMMRSRQECSVSDVCPLRGDGFAIRVWDEGC